MQIVRLFHDREHDSSALETVDIQCDQELAPGVADSAPIAAESFFFREVEAAGEVIGWHTAPFSQIVVVLDGGLRIVSSSGESRTFRAGEVILVEDVSGPGHQSWNYIGRRLHVRLPEGSDVLATTTSEKPQASTFAEQQPPSGLM